MCVAVLISAAALLAPSLWPGSGFWEVGLIRTRLLKLFFWMGVGGGGGVRLNVAVAAAAGDDDDVDVQPCSFPPLSPLSAVG